MSSSGLAFVATYPVIIPPSLGPHPTALHCIDFPPLFRLHHIITHYFNSIFYTDFCGATPIETVTHPPQ